MPIAAGWLGIRKALSRTTFLERVVIVAILVVVAALLLPPTKWAASDERIIPVEVFVFDSKSGRGIAGATVVIFRTPPLTTAHISPESRSDYSPEMWTELLKDRSSGVTGEYGKVDLRHTFRTGSSHQNPVPRVRVNWVWAEVRAPGYGGAVVPLRHEAIPSRSMPEVVFVPIGLIPAA